MRSERLLAKKAMFLSNGSMIVAGTPYWHLSNERVDFTCSEDDYHRHHHRKVHPAYRIKSGLAHIPFSVKKHIFHRRKNGILRG